jgi:hypothetical protein
MGLQPQESSLFRHSSTAGEAVMFPLATREQIIYAEALAARCTAEPPVK